MKKKVLTLLISCTLAFSCVGCSTTYQESINTNGKESYGNGYFTVVTKWDEGIKTYRIVYANDTKVKYLIIANVKVYAITPLYNEDGTLQVYDGE